MRFFILLLLIAVLSGCQPNYISSRPFSHPYDTIWETTYQVVSQRYDIARASKEEGTIETEWRAKMALNYLNSYRYKAYIKIEEYEPEEEPDLPEPGDIEEEPKVQRVVKIGVSQEQNRNVENPSAESEAYWFPDGESAEEAQRLINFINAKMATKVAPLEEEFDVE